MALTHSDRAAVALIVRDGLREPLQEITDRLIHLGRRQEQMMLSQDRMGDRLNNGVEDMRQQTMALVSSVAALRTAFTEYAAQMDAKLAAAQQAHDSEDDEAFDQAMKDMAGLKDAMTKRVGDVDPSLSTVAALAPTMPESPRIDAPSVPNAGATANPPSADPSAAPFDAAKVAGDSLGAQAVGAASTDGKPVDGHLVEQNPGAMPVPTGSPAALPADAATGTAPAGIGKEERKAEVEGDDHAAILAQTGTTLQGVDVDPRPVTDTDPLRAEPIAPAIEGQPPTVDSAKEGSEAHGSSGVGSAS